MPRPLLSSRQGDKNTVIFMGLSGVRAHKSSSVHNGRKHDSILFTHHEAKCNFLTVIICREYLKCRVNNLVSMAGSGGTASVNSFQQRRPCGRLTKLCRKMACNLIRIRRYISFTYSES